MIGDHENRAAAMTIIRRSRPELIDFNLEKLGFIELVNSVNPKGKAVKRQQ